MSDFLPFPPHLYAVVRFRGAVAGLFPGPDAAFKYRDSHCKGGEVYACRPYDETKLIFGARLDKQVPVP